MSRNLGRPESVFMNKSQFVDTLSMNKLYLIIMQYLLLQIVGVISVYRANCPNQLTLITYHANTCQNLYFFLCSKMIISVILKDINQFQFFLVCEKYSMDIFFNYIFLVYSFYRVAPSFISYFLSFLSLQDTVFLSQTLGLLRPLLGL